MHWQINGLIFLSLDLQYKHRTSRHTSNLGTAAKTASCPPVRIVTFAGGDFFRGLLRAQNEDRIFLCPCSWLRPHDSVCQWDEGTFLAVSVRRALHAGYRVLRLSRRLDQWKRENLRIGDDHCHLLSTYFVRHCSKYSIPIISQQPGGVDTTSVPML